MGIKVWYPDPADRYVICTSTTRPTGDQIVTGMMIYETDTNRVWVRRASDWYWVSGNDPYALHVYRSVTHTSFVIGGGNYLRILFDTEVVDAASAYASGVWICPVTRCYELSARVSIGAAAGERFIGSFFVNSPTTEIRGTDITARGTDRVTLTCHAWVDLTAGDTVDFWVDQVNGTARSIDPGATTAYMQIRTAA